MPLPAVIAIAGVAPPNPVPPPSAPQLGPSIGARDSFNALKAAAIGAEIAILGSTAAVAWGLVGGSHNLPVVAPMIVAATAMETLRLPIVLRIPKLGPLAAAGALTLALALSALTTETLALGFEGLLNERAIAVTAAETRLAEAQTGFDAAKADAGRRSEELARLTDAIAMAQKHSEEVGREAVALQNNPAVSAYRGRGGWRVPGAGAANTAAAANARAQAEHARRSVAAEADLAAARMALAAVKPIDIKAEEAVLVSAKQAVVRERETSPMHRLAASIFRVDAANLTAENYETVRRIAILSLATLVSIGTLAAGLISALPERGDRKPSKLARAIRAMVAARHKTLRRIRETVRTEYKERVRLVYVPVDASGKILDPDAKAKP